MGVRTTIMPDLVFYLVVFLAIGVFFLFIHLMIGKLIRPSRPDAEKLTIYECGEPTVGSAWIQFDLRYYVVALLFVIFDVEVAFFFPWAIVFGKANELAKIEKVTDTTSAERRAILEDRHKKITQELVPATLNLAYLEHGRSAAPKQEMKRPPPEPPKDVTPIDQDTARTWAWIAFFDILVFFGVLMVGFAYLWKRGDIDWVRSTAAESEPQ